MLFRRRFDRHDLDLTPGQAAQIAGLGTKQRTGDGRGVGDAAGIGLGLVLADDRVADLAPAAIDPDHRGAEADAGGGCGWYFEPGGGETGRPVTKLATGPSLCLARSLCRRERLLRLGHPILDLAQAASGDEIGMWADGPVGQHHGTAARVVLLDECSAQDGHSSSVEGMAAPLAPPDPGMIGTTDGSGEARMFESAMVAHKLAKEEYAREEPQLRTRLVEAQLDLLEQRAFAMLILVSGMDGAGKTEVMHKLSEWLDPRHLRVSAYGEPDEAERERPPMWRYWRDLPARGEIAVVFGSWHSDTLRDRLLDNIGPGRFERQLAALNRFEEMLTDEGIVLLKFLLVMSASEQKSRLKALAKRTDGASRVLEEWADVRRRELAGPIVEEAVRRTSTGSAPWIVLPCNDPQYRDLTFGRTVLAGLQERLAATRAPAPRSAPAAIPNVDRRNVLDALDLRLALDKQDYRKRLKRAQYRLLEQTQRKAFRDRALVMAFEGHDAAGKGGAIRRVAMALDPRQYRIHPIAAPTAEEKARPYLWRFWRDVPRRGRIAIFDRSWYGRVLVERVEGLASPVEWSRAYEEINDFEEELVDDGVIVSKFWLAIGKDEQLRRFEERAGTEYKQYKITDEDWRNREKWDLYHDAIGEMMDRTSTTAAPWTLVEAQDKRWARVKVLETLLARLQAEL